MMIRSLTILGALALVATANVASAQQPAPGGQQRVPPARGPETALALEAAQTAISTCAANGYKVAASIVDSAGVLKVLVAADGATKGRSSPAPRRPQPRMP